MQSHLVSCGRARVCCREEGCEAGAESGVCGAAGSMFSRCSRSFSGAKVVRPPFALRLAALG